ncbi:MAG: HD domain-containing protein [Paludibacteraceae bacterium]|nr:HD domain-containing protein [Paludibacteraceae bacterium]MBP6436332.1 HD domain-containing protein [Paludibacteraceae bacterium]MBP8627480.1 HD domain-containing protein [Paludibacteraceae bacterium]MBP9648173.1 HD domain-containing protein [Paludibacteraceae bacterium]MBP9970892.1 HD domain-containing protein [Paludibacteraceae bacterium]
MSNNKKKIINDPVFGFINIPGTLLYNLLQHPYVQRLTRIKQLGLSSYVYPGAQHTRFQHSLGAMYLMTEAIKTLKSKGISISQHETEAACAAILLHDVGHGPFSHALEGMIIPHLSHEEITLRIMQKINKEYEGKLDLALEIFQNTYHKTFLHQLVSGQLDMDRLDYLRRDSFFTGVTEGNIGSARIIKMLNIKNDTLVVEAKGIYSIENFLMNRRLMYWQVYFHKTAFAIEKMLIKTIERAKIIAKQDSTLFGTPSLLFFLRQEDNLTNDSALDLFLNLDDTDIMCSIKQWINHPDTILSTLSYGIIHRKLFKIEVSNEPFSKAKIEAKTTEIAQHLGINHMDATYFVSVNDVSINMYHNNEDSITILHKDGSIKPISQTSDMLDIRILSREVTKYYFSYYKITPE